MKKTLALILIAVLRAGAAEISADGNQGLRFNSPQKNNSVVRSRQDTAETVRKAFLGVRKGEYELSNKLVDFGERIFPYLEPYLKDESDKVRSQVVIIVLRIGGDKSLPIIAEALDNSSPEVQKTAAGLLYSYSKWAIKYLPLGEYSKFKTFLPENIQAQTAIGEALRRFVGSKNATPQGVFLLAVFPGKETEDVLRQTDAGKLKDLLLAAKIVLSGFNDEAATRELADAAATDDLDTLKYLLQNLMHVEAKEVLSALGKTLDNKTLIAKGREDGKIHERLPNGTFVEFAVARRLCDLAVNSFVERFDLKTSFRLHSTIYSDAQILEVRRLLKNYTAAD